MDLVSELKSSLDAMTPQLRSFGRHGATNRTQLIQDGIAAVAPKYAQHLGIGYGHQYDDRAQGDKTLYVHRSGGKPLGQFLFDQTWLVAHCTGHSGTEQFSQTGELKNGYPVSCDLAAEFEWNSHKHMYDDFYKLLVAKARLKIFVYNCPGTDIDDTLRSLDTYLISFGQKVPGEIYLVSCFVENSGGFHHAVRS